MSNREIRKLATENPILDEIIYQCQKMIQGIVIKDEERANNNETINSMKNSDMYKVIVEKKVKFEYFNYTYDLLSQIPSLTHEQMVRYSRQNQLIPESLKPTLLILAQEKFLNNYEEKNNYYRMLNGLPDTGEAGIHLNADEVNMINNDNFDYTKYVHEMTDDEINMLKSKGVLDSLIERYPKKEYLKHLGESRVDPYIAREAPNFSVLYMPACDSMEVYRKFSDRLKINREFILKTIYSEAYKFNSDYYDNFIMMMIIIQSFDDMIVLSPEYIITRDLFDLRTIQYIFEASGVTYYPEIPLKYQKRLVKNLNRLIKYSSSDKNFVDICSLFGFENIQLFKYYLLRQPIMNEDGSYKQDTKIDPETGLDIDDTESNYELKFVKVPVEGSIDDYVRNDLYHVSYDSVTDQDKYWNGVYEKDYVKKKILEHEFNLCISKYLSIDTLYSMTDMTFEVVYFINMLLYSGIDMSLLTIPLPELSSTAEFELTDLLITLYALKYAYYSLEDTIFYDPVNILDIKGFNFDVDWDKLSEYVYEQGFTMEELGIADFKIPSNGILNFNQLMEIYLNNKNIYNHVVEQLKNAQSKEIYDVYKKIYESLMISKLNYKYFKNAGNGKLPKTYTDYMENRNSFLYDKISNCKDILKEHDRQTEISKLINTIVDNIYIYLDSDQFRYIFQGIPTASLDYVKQYMFKVLNFFKSYKVDFISSHDVFYFNDKLENKFYILDSLLMKCHMYRKDILGMEDYIISRLRNIFRDGLKIEDDVYIEEK